MIESLIKARLHVPNLVTVAVKAEKWIGPSDFQQQQWVSGTVSTLQTLLTLWLDDRLQGPVNQVRFRTALLRLSVRNDVLSYPHRKMRTQEKILFLFFFYLSLL